MTQGIGAVLQIKSLSFVNGLTRRFLGWESGQKRRIFHVPKAPTLHRIQSMTTSSAQSSRRPLLSNEVVSSDFMALASHMTACQRSQSRFFIVRTCLESLHAFTAPRLVTTGIVLAAGGLSLIGLGLLTLA